MLDFPALPALGQVFGNWIWDGVKWTTGGTSSSGGEVLPGGGGTSVTVSDTPPVSPQDGDLWWNSAVGNLYIWYQDPSTSQWVIANNISGVGASVTVSDVPPSSPQQGDLWWNSAVGILYIWYQDPNSAQWVVA